MLLLFRSLVLILIWLFLTVDALSMRQRSNIHNFTSHECYSNFAMFVDSIYCDKCVLGETRAVSIHLVRLL